MEVKEYMEKCNNYVWPSHGLNRLTPLEWCDSNISSSRPWCRSVASSGRSKLLSSPETYAPSIPVNFDCAAKDIFVSGVPIGRDMLRTLEDFFSVGLVVSLISTPLTEKRLMNCNWTGVEFCDRQSGMTESVSEDLRLLHSPVNDSDTPTWQQISEIFEAVRQCRKNNKRILIHCWSGVSRSWLVVRLVLRHLDCLPISDLYFKKGVKTRPTYPQDQMLFAETSSIQNPRGFECLCLNYSWLERERTSNIQKNPLFTYPILDFKNLPQCSKYADDVSFDKLTTDYSSRWQSLIRSILIRSCVGDVELANHIEQFVRRSNVNWQELHLKRINGNFEEIITLSTSKKEGKKYEKKPSRLDAKVEKINEKHLLNQLWSSERVLRKNKKITPSTPVLSPSSPPSRQSTPKKLNNIKAFSKETWKTSPWSSVLNDKMAVLVGAAAVTAVVAIAAAQSSITPQSPESSSLLHFSHSDEGLTNV
eukprot:GHVL01015288.1.p1 GENE.GHVL01015288.1~~GHVL01015288.1.p1  ORF type:complete len:477 (+),score=102.52 GHVL01015288.1:48-1478(+)